MNRLSPAARACPQRTGTEREFLRSLRQSLSLAIDELGDGSDVNMLWSQGQLVSFGRRIDYVEAPAGRGGERDGLLHDANVAGIAEACCKVMRGSIQFREMSAHQRQAPGPRPVQSLVHCCILPHRASLLCRRLPQTDYLI